MTTPRHHNDQSTRVTRAIGRTTGWLGSFPAILLSVAIVIVWCVGGFFVQQQFANEVYQLVINTTTTVITFIMVFIIQNTQNRDGRAIQTKLDAQSQALAKVLEQLGTADTEDLLHRLVGVEDAPESDIKSEQDRVREQAQASTSASAPERPPQPLVQSTSS
jgi:low affinity Fe/Cu permease